MRVLITGLSGYIGPVMARTLRKAGHEITGLDTGYFHDCAMDSYVEDVPMIHKDIRDVTPHDLRGFDAVVHLAALSNDSLREFQPELTYAINLKGSLHLGKVARDAGVKRFLFSSSCSIYGVTKEEKATERTPLRPLSAYAVSKVKTEEGLDKLASPEFSPVFMRNATAYGVSPRMRLDLVVNNLTAWAITTGRVQVISDGTPWRPLVHIGDIASAFAAVLAAPRAAIHNAAFNVGGTSENYQVKDLAEMVRELIPHSAMYYGEGAAPDPRDYRVDFSKLQKDVPAFQPVWNARKGISELTSAFRRVGLQAADLQSRNYIRLKQLRYLMDANALDENLRWREAVAVA